MGGSPLWTVLVALWGDASLRRCRAITTPTWTGEPGPGAERRMPETFAGRARTSSAMVFFAERLCKS